MEMFKLLSRSTYLQKPAPTSGKATTQKVPSAGFSTKTQAQREDDSLSDVHTISTLKNNKRKRSLENNERGLDTSEQLDFFSAPAAYPDSTRPPTIGDGVAIAKPQQSRGGATSPTLSKEECRLVLKRNKIKITKLNSAHGAESEPQKSQKIVHEKNSSQKVPPTLLSPQPLTSFEQLRNKYRISRRLAENLNTLGYVDPTEVQLGSLPLLLGSDEDRGLILNGETSRKKLVRSPIDLLTVAPTGSGKTLAFMIGLIHGVLEGRRESRKDAADKEGKHHVEALIIVPTHELADQIVNEGRRLATGTGVKISGMRKGMKLHAGNHRSTADDDSSSLQHINAKHDSDKDQDSMKTSLLKANVVVSTPLMLLHAISPNPELPPSELPTVRYLVLDEADVLLDPLFRTQTLGIWAACNNPSMQVSLWSATIGSSIESLAQSFIVERRRNLKIAEPSRNSSHYVVRLVVGLKDSAIPTIAHRLIYAATEQGKLLALRQLLHPSTTSVDSGPSLQPPFLIFTQTIPRAIALHSELLYDISPEAGGSSRIAVLHSDISDPARSAIMAGFRKGEIWVLITTDLLSRGIDFRGLNGVVNYDIPNTGAAYVHRVGRTGRQGRKGGVAVTFYTKEDIPYVKNVANVIAASERFSGKARDAREGTVQRWLLDALPALSKKTKKELKLKGVEGRRSHSNDRVTGKEARRMRISTKSGYDRKLENNRKGAVIVSQRRKGENKFSDTSGSEDREWGGITE